MSLGEKKHNNFPKRITDVSSDVKLTLKARLNDFPKEFSNRIDLRPFPIGLSLGLKMT